MVVDWKRLFSAGMADVVSGDWIIDYMDVEW
jgi:hypothetical protein